MKLRDTSPSILPETCFRCKDKQVSLSYFAETSYSNLDLDSIINNEKLEHRTYDLAGVRS